ncbi:MAG: ribonuclease III [Phycisphaerales bacterium]|nr:ribonuclease III [Phycisphaerales bacterium]
MTIQEAIERAETSVGYTFNDKALLETSLTHASIANTRLLSNERLEFLGDAVLGLVVCSELYHKHFDKLEGTLTKVKSMVVSRKTCAEMADRAGLTDLLILGKGMTNRHHLPLSIRAAVYESVVGAIYVDGGLEPARQFVLTTTLPYVQHSSEGDVLENYKSALQQHAQRHLNGVPRYQSLDEQGPDHSKSFEVCVIIGEERFPSAWGPSKKEAEQKAARAALLKLTNGRHEPPCAP